MHLEAFTVVLREPSTNPPIPDGWVKDGHHELDLAVFELKPLQPVPNTDPGSAWELAYELRKTLGALSVEPILTDEDYLLALEGVGGTSGKPLPTGEDSSPEWVLRMLDVEEAWNLSRGSGILIAHPDSGFIDHEELRASLHSGGRDFVDPRRGSAEHRDASHGLAIGSVIVSPDDRASRPRSVTGIAPAAKLLPYRVAKKRWLLPVPVLLRSGMDRLRLAILSAVEAEAHVVSISLGWLRNRGVERAVRLAVDRGLIVCAAGGNFTPMVVWPAAYPECIALASCDVAGAPWPGSASGPQIAATAPGHNVWRAVAGRERVAPSSGTSYAVATTAGLAALWLAHHGPDAVRAAAGQGGLAVAELFRHCLQQSCVKAPQLQPPHYWGAGIVNARSLLEHPLPEHSLENAYGGTGAGRPRAAASLLERTFPHLAPEELQRRLKSVGVQDPSLDRIRPYEEEIVAEIVRDPIVRDFFGQEGVTLLETAVSPRLSLSRQAAGS